MKSPRSSFRTTVQPDYKNWKAVTAGDSLSRVSELIGEPRNIAGWMKVTGQNKWLLYGWLADTSLPPGTYEFSILYDENDHVLRKKDPFGGNLSEDGLPTRPAVLLPLAGSSFAHIPRILDLRWAPCSGQHPMAYDMEIGLGNATCFEEAEFSENAYDQQTVLKSTHVTIMFPGCQRGRFRIRAKNALGVSDWSEYRSFSFTR
jgi:hypothetical protein